MIEISDKAKSIIEEMINDNGNENLFLRVGIDAGGCSGLSYNIRLDDSITEFDRITQDDQIRVAWDNRTEEYLQGVHIDYLNQGMTGGFTIDNPNAKATCGCGASFRTANFKGTRQKCD